MKIKHCLLIVIGTISINTSIFAYTAEPGFYWSWDAVGIAKNKAWSVSTANQYLNPGANTVASSSTEKNSTSGNVGDNYALFKENKNILLGWQIDYGSLGSETYKAKNPSLPNANVSIRYTALSLLATGVYNFHPINLMLGAGIAAAKTNHGLQTDSEKTNIVPVATAGLGYELNVGSSQKPYYLNVYVLYKGFFGKNLTNSHDLNAQFPHVDAGYLGVAGAF